MNAELKECLEKLSEAVRESSEYLEYMQARKILNQDPDRRSRTEAFRRRNFQIQSLRNDQTPSDRVSIYREREELRKDPQIDRYLNAELVLCRLLRDISLEIMGQAELDLEFMDDLL